MRKVRNYNKLINELLNLNIPLRIELIGYLNYDEIYPMIAFKHITKMAKKNIVIVAGQHGDEYFAVHVLINWLKQLKLEDYSDFNFYIIPVANPTGYIFNRRRNKNRQQVNNADNFYRNSEVQELAVLFDYIPINLDLYLDVHGDTGKKSVYCYERKPDGQKSIAEKALLENDSVFPYERSQTIYREKVHNGVIYKPEHDRSLDDFMGNRGIAYTVTLELPKLCDGQQRMNGGIKLINSILKNFKEK